MITAAKLELARVKPTDKGQQECLKKAEAHLDEGKKALGTRQKHIMVADRSDYGWATVQQYDINPLAMDSEDEKRLEKAEKEAERLANKRRRAGNGATGKKPRRNWSEATSRREPSLMNQTLYSTQGAYRLEIISARSEKGLAHVTVPTGTGTHNFSEVLIAVNKILSL